MVNRHMSTPHVPKTTNPLIWPVLTIFFVILIYLVSSSPYFQTPNVYQFDKFAHAAVFGVLTLLAWQTLAIWLTTELTWFYAWLGVTLYGAGDEWHQAYVPGRCPDVYDWLADVTGATLAILAVTWYFARYQPARPFRLLPPHYREMWIRFLSGEGRYRQTFRAM